MEKSKDTNAEAVVEEKVEETGTETEKSAPDKTEEKTETAGDIIKKASDDGKTETVGLDKFLKEKNGRKAAEKALKDFKDSIEGGATSSETSADIDALAEEFGVDKSFLKKLAATIKTQAEKDAKGEIENRMKPLEEKDRLEKLDTAFKKAYKNAMEGMPEFDGIVNPDVIKSLSLDPKNADKTFSQIIEDTYGHLLTGKRTIETTKPGGGKEPGPLDFDRARRDSAYFGEVMDNPKLKAEYNKIMLEKGF